VDQLFFIGFLIGKVYFWVVHYLFVLENRDLEMEGYVVMEKFIFCNFPRDFLNRWSGRTPNRR
jgi:hypothetical protein